MRRSGWTKWLIVIPAMLGKLNDVDEDGLKRIYDMMN